MKNKSIRFGIYDDSGKRAATWKLFSSKSKADVYLVCRELRGALKASMHESGSWHFGYTKAAASKYFHDVESFENAKYIEMWRSPQPAVNGATVAFRIVTPWSSVRTPITGNDKDVTWIPNCSKPNATEIYIVICPFEITNSENWPGTNSTGTSLIGYYEIDNIQSVFCVYKYIAMPVLPKLPTAGLRFFKGKDASNLAFPFIKAIAFGDATDGSKTLYDLAIDTNKATLIT
jgi:hypothetical protein